MSHFVAEHSRDFPDKGWWLIRHDWDDNLIHSAAEIINAEGGPPDAHLSGTGQYEDRPLVEWIVKESYELVDGVEVLPGDKLRLWLQKDPDPDLERRIS